jgi:hypothetical protein
MIVCVTKDFVCPSSSSLLVDERILIGIDASRLTLAARGDSFGRQ